MSLLYTPGQLRDATGLSTETYRHWRKALEPLRRDGGHSPTFTPGDLVAVAVARLLTDNLGMRIGVLRDVAISLFAVCNGAPWHIIERKALVVDPSGGSASLRVGPIADWPDTPVVVLPLAGVISSLRATLLAPEGPDQQPLRFPPTSMTGVRRSSR